MVGVSAGGKGKKRKWGRKEGARKWGKGKGRGLGSVEMGGGGEEGVGGKRAEDWERKKRAGKDGVRRGR